MYNVCKNRINQNVSPIPVMPLSVCMSTQQNSVSPLPPEPPPIRKLSLKRTLSTFLIFILCVPTARSRILSFIAIRVEGYDPLQVMEIPAMLNPSLLSISLLLRPICLFRFFTCIKFLFQWPDGTHMFEYQIHMCLCLQYMWVSSVPNLKCIYDFCLYDFKVTDFLIVIAFHSKNILSRLTC